jgi:hypothetical protein
MTKEQIKTHREVIKWWIDNPDKGVWYKNSLNEWIRLTEPEFSEYFIYLQNDEYAEFRKALVDGKIVQHNLHSDCAPKYRDVYETVNKIIKSVPASCYRIKPEEPEFKVGDWIIDKSSGFIIQAYEDMLVKNFKKWKPTKGEFCVFYDDSDEFYGVGRFIAKNIVNEKYSCETISGEWSNVAPLEFVGTLKR